MLRSSFRRLSHAGLSGERLVTYLEPSQKPPLFRRIRQRIGRWPTWKRIVVGVTAPLISFGAYVGVATVIHEAHRSTVDSLFDADFPGPTDNVLEDWATIAPTLREGDIVLLMGTGSMSWKICNSQMVHSFWKASSMRYSHVAVVVKPQQRPQSNEMRVVGSSSSASSSSSSSFSNRRRTSSLFHAFDKTSPPPPTGGPNNNESTRSRGSTTTTGDGAADVKPQTATKGPWMLEAVDNKDVQCPDIDGTVRHDQVQIVAVRDRVYGKEGDRPCYHRFAIRRLQGFEWTPERREKLQQFLASHVGRSMDKSPLIMLSFVHPKLYDWFAPRLHNEIACSELIVELYKAVGAIDENANGPMRRSAIQVAPYHFAEGNEKVLELTHGVSLGPEMKIPMRQLPRDQLYRSGGGSNNNKKEVKEVAAAKEGELR